MSNTHKVFKLQEPIQHFIDNAEINIYQGSKRINIIDYFPQVRGGYGSIKTLFNLLQLYTISKKLYHPTIVSKCIPDELISESFNGDIIIPDHIIKFHTFSIGVPVGHQQLLFGENTFNILSILGTFQPSKYDINVFGGIASLNLDPNDYIITSTDEYNLSDELLKLAQHDRLNDKNILTVAIDTLCPILTNKLLSDHNVDPSINNNEALLMAIKRSNVEGVSNILSKLSVNPRINNNEALDLAKEIGNTDITKLISDRINDLDKQDIEVLSDGFKNLDKSGVIFDILKHTRELY